MTTKGVLVLVLLAACGHAERNGSKYRVTPTRDATTASGVYIPVDLEDAFRELDKMLSKEFKEEFRRGTEDDTAQYHFGLGMWMRNNWGLWAGSRLAKSLLRLGLRHPDDMSGTIITAYWRRLNGKELGIESEAQSSQEYWDSAEEPKDRRCPSDRAEMDLGTKLVENAANGHTTIRHVGTWYPLHGPGLGRES